MLPASLGARCVKLATTVVRVVFMYCPELSAVKPFTVFGLNLL